MPPYLIATKLAAFSSRGRGNHLGSRDLEDVILLVDGREEIVAEVAEADDDVRAFIATELAMLLRQARFLDAIFAFLRADMASQARAKTAVLPRLHAIAGG